MTPVRIEWWDAHDIGAGDGWLDPGNLDDGPCVVTTVGYLLKGSKAGHLLVAQSITPDCEVRNPFAIPIGMVRRIVALSDGTALPVEPQA